MSNPEDANSNPPLTPEQTILWLEGIRALMVEVWKKNPELRKQWEMLREKENQKAVNSLKPNL